MMNDAGEAALSLRHLSKSFGGERALKDTDFVVGAREIYGLVGRNGSGKSTLIKILSGFHSPDPGAECRIAGQRVNLPLDPASARALGLVFVHQDLALAPGCSVLENMRIGRYSARGLGRINWQRERERVSQGLKTSASTSIPTRWSSDCVRWNGHKSPSRGRSTRRHTVSGASLFSMSPRRFCRETTSKPFSMRFAASCRAASAQSSSAIASKRSSS